MGGFIPGVKMYAYANGHAPERKMVPSMYFQMLKAIVIQHPVIDPPTGSALTVNGFVLPGISRNAGMEAQAGMVFNVDSTPITAGRTFRFIWAGTAAGRKMPAERGRMGNRSGAVPGEGKVLRANQPKAGRRQYGKDGKDYLE